MMPLPPPLPALAAALLLALAGCARGPKPAPPPPKTWLDMPSEERQRRLVKHPFLDTRVVQCGAGDMEFLEAGPVRDSSARLDTSVIPAVYIHGLGGTVGDFAPFILERDDDEIIVAVNLPGTGRSSNDEHDFTIKAHADAIHELIVHRMGYDKADLVCHSLGGQVCIAYALEYPANVGSLTLIDAAGSYNRGEYVQRMAKSFGKVNLGNVLVSNHPAIAILTGGHQDLIRRIVGGDASLLSALDSFNQNYRDRIRNLNVPVLLIWGEKDPIFPVQYGFFLLSNIPKAQLKVVPGAGHVPQLSHPALVKDWIDAFRDSLSLVRN